MASPIPLPSPLLMDGVPIGTLVRWEMKCEPVEYIWETIPGSGEYGGRYFIPGPATYTFWLVDPAPILRQFAVPGSYEFTGSSLALRGWLLSIQEEDGLVRLSVLVEAQRPGVIPLAPQVPPGSLCEHCLDAPAFFLRPAPWGGEMGVCKGCARQMAEAPHAEAPPCEVLPMPETMLPIYIGQVTEAVRTGALMVRNDDMTWRALRLDRDDTCVVAALAAESVQAGEWVELYPIDNEGVVHCDEPGMQETIGE